MADDESCVVVCLYACFVKIVCSLRYKTRCDYNQPSSSSSITSHKLCPLNLLLIIPKMTIKRSSSLESMSKIPQESTFFASFPGFDHHPNNPVSKEFKRLAKWTGWKNGSKKWRKNWNRCMAEQYDLLIGDRINDLATWQQMCRKLDIPGEFPSINKCRQVGPHHACHVWPIKLTICFAYTLRRYRMSM